MNNDAVECIRHHVWSGFYNPGEILTIVTEEAFEPGEIDTGEASAIIASEVARKTKEEALWPSITDCDKLDTVFKELNAMGIIALQNAGYTQSDGMSDMTERYEELGGESSPVIGYCFYHGQDLERAVRGEGLMVTFGDIKGTDEKGIEIGRIIKDKLSHAGFTVKWNGTIGQRLEIETFDWKRRGPCTTPTVKKPWWKVW